MVDVLDLSNLSIPVAALLGATWLFMHDKYLGWAILLLGIAWWVIGEIIKWERMKYLVNHRQY